MNLIHALFAIATIAAVSGGVFWALRTLRLRKVLRIAVTLSSAGRRERCECSNGPMNDHSAVGPGGVQTARCGRSK